MKLEYGKDREKVIRQAHCHCQLSHANPAQRNITIKVLPSMQTQLFLLRLLRELNDQHFVSVAFEPFFLCLIHRIYHYPQKMEADKKKFDCRGKKISSNERLAFTFVCMVQCFLIC